jgi:GTP1/Obg family GTP-binding protein
MGVNISNMVDDVVGQYFYKTKTVYMGHAVKVFDSQFTEVKTIENMKKRIVGSFTEIIEPMERKLKFLEEKNTDLKKLLEEKLPEEIV